MDEYRHDEHKLYGHKKHCFIKYLGVILATLIGSFLAFYFAVNCAMNHFMSKGYAIRQFHKMERFARNDVDKFDKDFSGMDRMFHKKSAVEMFKTPDAYKFIVDLIPFQGNAESINVTVEGNNLTISGEANSVKNNVDTFVKMSQTYTLCRCAKTDKISKKKVNNKYIITVPIED